MNIFRKIMVLGIIGLFIGAGVVPSISGKIEFSMKEQHLIYSFNTDNIRNTDKLAISRTGPNPPENCFMGYTSEKMNDDVIIEGIPSYNWYRGCGPTATGMVIGHWDSQGYNELVDGSASTQTSFVNTMISSYDNYIDYCLPIDTSNNIKPDKSELPEGDEHSDNCIADFMKTSQSYHNLPYGWSWYKYIDDSIRDYCEWKCFKYKAIVKNIRISFFTWEKYCEEINASRPVILLVDTDGNGNTDHFITAIGYRYRNNEQYYACYNTWDDNIHWYDYRKMDEGDNWGIYGGTTCFFTHVPNKPQIPQGPSTGKPNEQQNFTTTTSESDNDQIWFKWDWGDNSSTNWIGPFQSNEICNSSHIWIEKGDYEIRVKAKDVYEAESEWSDSLIVSMPNSKPYIKTQVQVFLENYPNMFPLLKYILAL